MKELRIYLKKAKIRRGRTMAKNRRTQSSKFRSAVEDFLVMTTVYIQCRATEEEASSTNFDQFGGINNLAHLAILSLD